MEEPRSPSDQLVCVNGASGYIASHVVRELLRSDRAEKQLLVRHRAPEQMLMGTARSLIELDLAR